LEGNETEDIKLIREAIDTLSQKEKEVIWAMSISTCAAIINGPRLKTWTKIVRSLGISRENFRKNQTASKSKNIAVHGQQKTHTGGKMKSRDPLNPGDAAFDKLDEKSAKH